MSGLGIRSEFVHNIAAFPWLDVVATSLSPPLYSLENYYANILYDICLNRYDHYQHFFDNSFCEIPPYNGGGAFSKKYYSENRPWLQWRDRLKTFVSSEKLHDQTTFTFSIVGLKCIQSGSWILFSSIG